MKKLIFISQIIVVIFQLVVFFFSEKGVPSFFVINFSANTVIISFLLSFLFRNQTYLKGHNFSIILFFTLMSWIISFQVPLEIVYGNTKLLDPTLRLVYDYEVLNKLVAFSSLMLNLFLLGATFSYNKSSHLFHKSKIKKYSYNTSSKPLFVLIVFCVIAFVLTVNSGYVNSGHGKVKLDELSATAIGFIIKFSAMYLSIKLYEWQGLNLSKTGYILKLNLFYVGCLLFITIIFFMAHNRFYPIMLLTPLLFSFFVGSFNQIRLVTVPMIFLTLSVFATLFKIYGISDFYKYGLHVSDGYTISQFFFPFTAELAGSIYSSTILYSLWDATGFSLNGISYLVGLFRGFPGVMAVLNMNPISYDSAVIATSIAGTSYGVGTASIVDLLVNFGLTVSLLGFFILGYFFGRSEMKVYAARASIISYVIYFTITILILFFPRSSLNDLVGMLVFNLIFIKFYLLLFGRKRK